jgi:hypothetical protein
MVGTMGIVSLRLPNETGVTILSVKKVGNIDNAISKPEELFVSRVVLPGELVNEKPYNKTTLIYVQFKTVCDFCAY